MSVDVHLDGARLTVSLNRGAARNALDRAMVSALREAILPARRSDGPRVVVLRSDVPGAFSIGMDLDCLRDAKSPERSAGYDAVRDYVALLTEWVTMPAATIAVVNGIAVGGGVDLLAACDIAIAAEDASFSIAQLRNGIFPLTTSAILVPKIGQAAFLYWAFSGLYYSARKAEALGLVSQVVAPAEVEASARNLADRICRFDADALRLGLDAIRFGATAAVVGRLQQVSALLGLNCRLRMDRDGP